MCLALACIASADARVRQDVPRTGAISGVVTLDPAGAPLPGVMVALLDGRVQVSVRAITDSKGRFVFRDLPASRGYILEASKSGYVASALVMRPLFTEGARLPLADGEWISNVHITMSRLGAIAGTVFDERGEPVVSVPVHALAEAAVAGTTQWVGGPLATTDDRGFYRISGLRPGRYVIMVPSVQSVVPGGTPAATVAGMSAMRTALGGAAVPRTPAMDMDGSWLVIGRYATPPPLGDSHRVYPIAYPPGVRSLSESSPVELGAGEERRGIDVVLQPVRSVRIRGRVTGPADAVAGLVLRLMPRGTESLGEGSEQATALVGRDGSFAFLGVPEGAYTIDARATIGDLFLGGGALRPSTPGVISDQLAFTTIPSSLGDLAFRTKYTATAGGYLASVPITVDGVSDVTGVHVALERGISISGRIVAETGIPVRESVRVRLEPADGDPFLGTSFITSDPSGTFAVEGLRPGAYFLRVAHGRMVVKSIRAGGDYTERPFDAVPGTHISDVIVTLTDKGAALSGTIRDPSGSGLAEALVVLFPADPVHWARFGLEPPRIRAVTCFGSRGYQTARVPAGEYYVIAVSPTMHGAWHDARFFPAAAPLATRVTLDWGASRIQDLTIRQVTLK